MQEIMEYQVLQEYQVFKDRRERRVAQYILEVLGSQEREVIHVPNKFLWLL